MTMEWCDVRQRSRGLDGVDALLQRSDIAQPYFQRRSMSRLRIFIEEIRYGQFHSICSGPIRRGRKESWEGCDRHLRHLVILPESVEKRVLELCYNDAKSRERNSMLAYDR